MYRMSLLEWLDWRRQGICSTDASIIMGVVPSHWGTVGGLWLEKTGRPTPPRERTYRMKRGHRLEPKARAWYERKTGIKMPAVCVENAKNPIIRASLDGINDEVRRSLEIKCPGREDHAAALQGRIPEKYVWQCVHQCMTTEYEQVDYVSFDGEDGVIVEFHRDEKLERELYEAESRFWEFVVKDIAPPRLEPKPEVRAKAAFAALSFQEKYQNVLQFRRRG